MTDARVERTRNRHDTATVSSAISAGSTSIVLAIANEDRLFFRVNIKNGNGNGVWIKLQAASVDDDKKGIFLLASEDGGELSWTMPPDNIYTGEICAIRQSNTTDVYVTEY